MANELTQDDTVEVNQNASKAQPYSREYMRRVFLRENELTYLTLFKYSP